MYTNHGWLPPCEFHIGEIRVYVSGPLSLWVIIICTVILTPQNRLHDIVTLTCANLSATHNLWSTCTHVVLTLRIQKTQFITDLLTCFAACLPSGHAKNKTSLQDSQNRNRPSISEKIMDTHVTQMLTGKKAPAVIKPLNSLPHKQTSVDYRGPSRCHSSLP